MINISILLVDDRRQDLFLMEEALDESSAKFDVYTADDGEKAISMFKDLSPDLVLMDINMPKMNGIEALKTIKELNTDAVVIMMTTSLSENDITKCKEEHATGYMMKPVDTGGYSDRIELLISLFVKKSFEFLKIG